MAKGKARLRRFALTAGRVCSAGNGLMAIKFPSVWERLTMIPGSGRNFTPLSNAGRRGTRLRMIFLSMRNGELSRESERKRTVVFLTDLFLSAVPNLIEERTNSFVALPSADSLYTPQVIGALERTCLDNALCHNGTDPRNVLEFH